MGKTMTELQHKVQKALLENSHTEKLAIELLDDNGVITLKGHVPSRKASNTAKSIAEKVPGVAGVINMLEIKDYEKDENSDLPQIYQSFIQR